MIVENCLLMMSDQEFCNTAKPRNVYDEEYFAGNGKRKHSLRKGERECFILESFNHWIFMGIK